MSEPTYYSDDNSAGRVATTCVETDKPVYSELLGPNGKPLEYKQNPVGFLLRKNE